MTDKTPPGSAARPWNSERLPDEIRSLHPVAFRCGQWARVVGIVSVRGRVCWEVQFPDGARDQWVVDDWRMARYEYR